MTDILATIREARRLGQVKAEEIQAKIQTGILSWYPCGGAWISGVKRNTKFGKVFSMLANTQRGYGLYGPRSASVHWSISGPETQAMVLDAEASKVFVAHINEKLGLSLTVRSYID